MTITPSEPEPTRASPLESFIQTFAPRCPGCQWADIKIRDGRCAQCGVRLKLGLGAPRGVLTWWLLIVSGVALGVGFTVLVSLLAMFNGAGMDAVELYLAGIVNLGLFVAVFTFRSDFLTTTRQTQMLLAIFGLLALGVVDFIAMWMAIE